MTNCFAQQNNSFAANGSESCSARNFFSIIILGAVIAASIFVALFSGISVLVILSIIIIIGLVLILRGQLNSVRTDRR